MRTGVLEEAQEPLSAAYDLVMLDLDGVVYVGPDAVPGAPDHLAEARRRGLHVAFVTNNASRPPSAVARHLTELGIEAEPTDVVTSAQAAAHLLVERFGAGAKVYLLGGAGLEQALEAEGLVPVLEPDEEPVAMVSGYGPDVTWSRVMTAAMLARHGLPWVASNTDLTIPTPQGPGPGHGVQVRMLSDFAGVEPVVAGKPRRPLLDETVRRVGGERPLMVGDRLDTDIEGAVEAGVASLLVLTGVTGLAEMVAAGPGLRPTYVAADLGGLFVPHGVPTRDGDDPDALVLGGWRSRVVDGALRVEGAGERDDWWRVAASAAWAHLDAEGEPCDTGDLEPPTSGAPVSGRSTVSP